MNFFCYAALRLLVEPWSCFAVQPLALHFTATKLFLLGRRGCSEKGSSETAELSSCASSVVDLVRDSVFPLSLRSPIVSFDMCRERQKNAQHKSLC